VREVIGEWLFIKSVIYQAEKIIIFVILSKTDPRQKTTILLKSITDNIKNYGER